jgi:hypothetical protein
MASNNNGADFEASAGQQATEGEVPQLSKQELKRAEKEARRAEKKAAKEAKKAKKAGAGNPPVPADAQTQSQPQIAENAAPAAFPQTVEGMYSPAVDQGIPVPTAIDGQEGEVQAYPYEDNGHGFVPASVGDANPYSRYAYMGSADTEFVLRANHAQAFHAADFGFFDFEIAGKYCADACKEHLLSCRYVGSAAYNLHGLR